MKQIIVLGDIEMGGGTLTDDFISDRKLAKLIKKLAKRKNDIDLVLNGDTIDFLKCPYIKDGKRSYPRHITEQISLTKLQLVVDAHKPVFNALKEFISKKGKRIYFIIGNHDHDLFWRGVQSEIRSILHAENNVFFPLEYTKNRVHIEHGHQYDYLNRINPDQVFLDYHGRFILNIPWIAFGIVSRFMEIKERHPFLERVQPRPNLFAHHKTVVKELSGRGIEYMLKGLLYYPIRYFYDPTYSFPKVIFRELYRRWKDQHWAVDSIVEKFKGRNKETLSKNKIYVFGHVHERYLENKGNYVIIHPDTWRDEYLLDKKTKILTPKTKTYVEITVDGKDVQWEIVETENTRKTLYFDDVTRKQREQLHLVAKEEGYKIPRVN